MRVHSRAHCCTWRPPTPTPARLGAYLLLPASAASGSLLDTHPSGRGMALHLPGSLLDTHPSGGWRCTCRRPMARCSTHILQASGGWRCTCRRPMARCSTHILQGMALHLPSPNGSLLDTHPSGGWRCTCRRPMARCSTHILQGDGAAPRAGAADWPCLLAGPGRRSCKNHLPGCSAGLVTGPGYRAPKSTPVTDRFAIASNPVFRSPTFAKRPGILCAGIESCHRPRREEQASQHVAWR
jgi:hypothetical protein